MQLMANYRPWQLFAVINCAVMLDDQDPKSVKRSNKRFGFGPPGPWDPPDTTRPNKITTMTTTKPIFSVMLNDQDQKSVKGRNKRFGGFANYGGSKYGNDMGDSNPMEWSSWDGWSSCSKTCGTGEQKRIRSCPTICGPENDGVQTKSCNSGLDCPPNYGSWGVWSNCSKSCGDGTNTRSRICNENCDKVVSQNDLYQSGTCYEGECPAESSEWGNWTPCSKTCGEGQRKMTRSCIEFCDTVKPSDLLIIETCKFGDCASEFSTWSVWSPCSLTCGGGQRTKTRSCIKYCSNSDESYLSYTGFCNFADCPNTKFSSWSQWSSCSHTCGEGSKSRDRFCSSNCDNVKSSDLSDTSSCNIRNCLSNSKFSSWSVWSACSHTCGDGHKSRARSCLTNCDNVKSSDLSDTGSCNIRNCRNSKLSSWSVWSSCSHTCGDGYKSRDRSCVAECANVKPIDLSDTSSCNIRNCQNSKFSSWSVWSSCSHTCGDGYKSRDRSCVAECANATPIDLSDTAVCFAGECPAKFSSWVEWASCSKTCGDGFKTRARFCTALCDNVKPIDLLDSIYCNLGVCASELSSWSVWSSCSTTCGNGDKSRVRSCITNCDNIEPNLLSDTTSCIVVKCPPIFTFWSEWSTCSHRCGYGIETRTRPCIAHCENFNSTDLSESRSCYESICVPQCDLKQLTKPKNAAHWVCNKPIENEAVPKLSKCRIVCLEGYDSIKGKKSLWRNFHRCRKNGLWQKPLDVSISCEPNGDFFNEKFRMAENLNKQYKNDLNFFKTAAQTNNSHLENLQKETASLENTNKNLELKYQTLQNEADNIERETTNLIHETRQLQYECRSMRNESDGLKEKTFSLINNNNYWELEYQTLRNELNYLEQKSYSQSPADKIKLQCQANQTTNYPFQQSENIVLSIVRKEGDSRRSDVCLGLSTNLGVFTSSVCCKADETILYDFENSKEISIESKSFWIEDNICFIKPTESVEFDFRTMEGEIKQLCKIMIYDTSEGYFIQKKIEIEIDDCYKTVCEFDMFSKLHQNQIIMNGTSILCDSSSQLGIITKSYTNTKLIEFVMLSKFNIDKLELYSDDLLEANEQVYEEVPGFESLSQKLQTRTTAFSCRKESDDYDLNLLTNRPLPWVVRVFFQSENTLSGTICSATIIDRYWLVTSKKCCLNKESFKVIFHDENKSQWLFEGKRRVQKCIRKKFCPRMHPREDKNIDICLLELREDVIESGRMNNVLLRSICLPEQESLTGSSCFTSGINRNSKIIDAVPLNLFSYTFCEKHSSYSNFDITLNENQLCAGLPSNNDLTAAFDGKHEEDFGGPLICLDKTKQMPIFTGVASFNSLSTVNGQPGIYTDIFKNKGWIQNMTAAWSQWSECLGSCVTSRRRVCSEQYGCNGLEYEERECPDTSNSCFQPLSDMIDDDLQYCSMLENSKIIKSRNRRVVNGLPVREFWDWLVRLEFLTDNSDLSSLCGGTVIHRNFVLTAAHCCIGKDSVLMNFKDKSRRNVDEKQFQLRSRIFHIYPKYGESDNSQNFDICLIKTAPDDFGMHYDLSKQFEMIPCLPDNIDLQKEHGKECWVAGWGQAQSNGVSSDSLKSIGVNLFDHQYCKDHSYYSDDNEFILNEDELCAGLPHNSRQGKNIKNNYVTAPGKDACQGDSGGPLVCSINEKAILVGVVSHGSGCGEEGKPGIYAKVDFFNDWFKSVIVEPSFVLITNPFENTFKHAIQLNFIDAPRMSDFTINDNTEAYFSCTTVLNGETYVFGGKTKYNQLSKIESCGLKRHGNLPFTSSLHAQIYCGTFKFGKINEKALICRSQQCYSYDGKSMQKSKSTTHVHDGVVMTEYEDEPFIVGDYNHNEIEFMHSTHEKWYTATPFPFTDRLFGYAAVSRPGKVFILGGCCYHDWRKVSVFENDSWNEKGQLKQGRINFSALIYHTDILIIGGISKDQKPVLSESYSLVGSHNYYDLELPNAMFINGITIPLKNSEICGANYIDSRTPIPDLIPDPRIYNLTPDFTYIHQKWGSFFYKYIGSKNKTEAKHACSQYGDSVHLPVPRFPEEQFFYRTYFAHKNLWLDISHEEHGLKSSSGHFFTNRFQTFSGVTEISRYNWMNYTASNYPKDRGLILTKIGWWKFENESELHESVCVYDIIPDDCLNCVNQGRLCRFKDTEEEKTECLCSNTESTRNGKLCENLCGECQNEQLCKVNNANLVECICEFPFQGDKCEKKGAVLVLSKVTENSLLIKANGEIDPRFDPYGLQISISDLRGSCAASINNKMFVFGGINDEQNKRRVAKVTNCALQKHTSTLSFDFVYGVCNTFSFGILLCFSRGSVRPDEKDCKRFDGSNDFPVISSNFYHGGVGALGIYRGKPFVTGSNTPNSNSKTEILDNDSWIRGADYPFKSADDFHHYVTTSTEESVYIFASPIYERSIIAEYKNNEWFIVESLNQPRFAGGAITFGPVTMIFGGTFNPNPNSKSRKKRKSGNNKGPGKNNDEGEYDGDDCVDDCKEYTDWRDLENNDKSERLHTEIWTIRKLEHRISTSTVASMSYNDVGTFHVHEGFCE